MLIGEDGAPFFDRNRPVAFHIDGPIWPNNHIHVLKPNGQTDARWLAYALNCVDYSRYIYGSTRDKLTQSALMRIVVAVPPTVEEQRTIADFLDRETARIDTLIEEQQRLIDLLLERRQATLDETIASLAATPVPLRRITDFLTSGSRGWGAYYSDEGERFLRIGNLPRHDLRLRGEIEHVDLPPEVTEGERTRLELGDLLFSITAYLGSVAVVDQTWINGYVSQHVALCRLDSRAAEPRFIGWAMLTSAGQNQLQRGAAGGTKLQLALDDIRSLQVPLPSISEQRRIANTLDSQISKIDTLVVESDRFIELARERRAALITAAVTGQIDVRDGVA
ncbi:restriction endonuclease subunit S [Gordonia alkaliphila]|uniref:Restriction endonuclease subunit S n=1 Tax=Gordonia alkaliphila TaxID=1053547 RepID=A0ABP8YTG0_9ACTN